MNLIQSDIQCSVVFLIHSENDKTFILVALYTTICTLHTAIALKRRIQVYQRIPSNVKYLNRYLS